MDRRQQRRRASSHHRATSPTQSLFRKRKVLRRISSFIEALRSLQIATLMGVATLLLQSFFGRVVKRPPSESLLNLSLPKPIPRMRRPPLSRSSVAVSLAALAGRRRASRVTIGPNITLSVAAAIAVSVIHGSATSRIGLRQRTWSQTKTPCHPRSSASAARFITAGIGEFLKRRKPQT